MKRSALKPSTKPMSRTGILRTASVQLSAKPIKCKVCRNPFERSLPKQTVCGAVCAESMARLKREKAERAALKVRREELQPRKWWLAKTRTALHAYIRARDEGKSCISCDTILVKLGRVGGDYDAGHFRSVGSAKHLQFVENNIHGQCKRCNDYLKGNQTEYERGLVERFGAEYVEALKNDNAPRHLTIDDFKAIEVEYKAKLKALQANQVLEAA